MAYVDTNIFVYAAVETPSSYKAVQSKLILKKVAAKNISASTSVLTWDELVWACKKFLPQEEAGREGRLMLKFPNLRIKDVTVQLAEIADRLMEKYSIKPRDAIHAATAILSNEKEIISDDADFDKVKELKRITLAEASR